MGKKPAPKGKAKAKAEPKPVEVPEEESAEKLEAKRLWQQRRDATKWAKAQLEVIRNLQLLAKARGNCDWLLIAHDFHEVRLIKACKRLEEKTLDDIPADLRAGVEAYVAQCAGGVQVEQDNFKEHRQVWDLLPSENGADAYQRPGPSPEAAAAAEKAKVWKDVSVEGIADLVVLMQEFLTDAAMQDVSLVRLGGLFAESREENAAPAPGLTAGQVMPAIERSMKGHPSDPEVQRSGCAALRGLAMASGQLPGLCDAGGVHLVVEAVRMHYKIKDVVSAGNSAFWAMAKAAGKNSPELAAMREAGSVEVLMKCMDHHAWDQTLTGRIRMTLPFITED